MKWHYASPAKQKQIVENGAQEWYNKNYPGSYKSLSDDDPDLLAFQQKVKGTRFENMLNPYLNYDYDPSIVDQFGDLLGFKTHMDELAENQQMKARAWMSDVLKELSDDEYNSPIEQKKRNSMAGINSDLQGLGNVAQASQFDYPMSDISYDPTSDTRDFGASLGQAFSSALALATTGFDLKSALMSIEGQDISQANQMSGIASRIASNLSPSVQKAIMNKNYSIDDYDRDFGDMFHWKSSRNKRAFITALRTELSLTTNKTGAFKNETALGEAMIENSDLQNSSWFDWSFKTMGLIRQPLVNMMDSLTKLSLDKDYNLSLTEMKNAQNQSAYLDKARELGLPENLAETDYATAISNKFTADYNKSYHQFRSQVLKDLHNDAKKNPFSRFLEFCWLTGFTPNTTTAGAFGLKEYTPSLVDYTKDLFNDAQRNRWSDSEEWMYGKSPRGQHGKKKEPRHGKRGKVTPWK